MKRSVVRIRDKAVLLSFEITYPTIFVFITCAVEVESRQHLSFFLYFEVVHLFFQSFGNSLLELHNEIHTNHAQYQIYQRVNFDGDLIFSSSFLSPSIAYNLDLYHEANEK